ncbi:MAG: demethylmenaquinone methyltransferase [Propionibacteriaceae bacterium]|nr:demethylmenaquinone methyltransferase [Propionibacteriaceae bacterium]
MSTLTDRLRRLDTCAVSDALDRCGVTGAALAQLKPQAGHGVVAGKAVTVRLGVAPAGAAPSGRHLGTAAVVASGPDDVIVVAHQGRTDCAGWGGLLSRAARARGVEGVIIDGAARDLAEADSIGFPVWALMGVPMTARGRTSELAWNEPIDMAGCPVEPGDLVIADVGGVVFIPAARADEVIEAAEKIAATEAVMAEAIHAGRPVTEVMGKSYEELTGK